MTVTTLNVTSLPSVTKPTLTHKSISLYFVLAQGSKLPYRSAALHCPFLTTTQVKGGGDNFFGLKKDYQSNNKLNCLS